MRYTENSTLAQLAKEYLNNKKRTVHYAVEAFDDDYCLVVTYLQPFTDEEIEGLRELMNKYGDDYTKHLIEVFKDEDYVHDLSVGDEIIRIDLDTPHYMCQFKTHKLLEDGTLYSSELLLELSDDDYLHLLMLHLQYDGMNMNQLRYGDRELYDKLQITIDYHQSVEDIGICISCPYLVTMDEIRADADLVKAAHPEIKEPGYFFEHCP